MRRLIFGEKMQFGLDKVETTYKPGLFDLLFGHLFI